jgi:Fe-S cluster assembly protein SufD
MPLLSVESQSPWLAELAGAPLPNRREEAWRFTDLALLRDLEPTVLPVVDPLAGMALPEGVSRLSPAEWAPLLDGSLAATGSAAAWLTGVNRAADPQVLALKVTGEAGPLELAWDAGSAKGLVPLRVLLVLEPGSSLDALLVVSSSGANCTSLITEVVLAEKARLNLGFLALGHGKASLLAQMAVTQEPGSALGCTTATAGWGLVRLEPRVLQSAGAAHTRLRGLQLVDGEQLADTHSLMTFGGPEGELDQVHKVVANGSGRSVFNGAVKVPQAAQQTNASQLSRSLLLSDRARVDTKPELEIVADDVKCAHGATVSRLQENELFYLQSRGIGADQAARLLLRGYCDEVLRELPAMAKAWNPLARLLGDGA